METSELAPLRGMAIGLILVVADLRIDGIDVIPDPVGWALVMIAAWQVRSRHAAFRWAFVAGALGLLSSLPGWVGAEGSLLMLLDTLATTGLVFATCTGIAARSARHGRLAGQLRWWDLGLTLPPLLLTPLAVDDSSGLSALVPLVLVWGLAVFVVFVVFLVLLFRVSRAEPQAVGAGSI